MAYKFNHVTHCVYKNTFLKDIRIAVDFPAKKADCIDAAKLQEYFNGFDGADIKVEDFLKRGNILIVSANRDNEFRFGLDCAEAKMSASSYSSFDGAWSFWMILEGFLKALEVKAVSTLTVRKFNALYFTTDKKDYDIREVMGGLFCDELMKEIPEDVISNRTLNCFEQTWTDRDEDSRTAIEVVFGIKKADSIDKKDRLTLVTLVKSSEESIPIEQVLNNAKRYNQILFDLFHWCVNDDIINSMK